MEIVRTVGILHIAYMLGASDRWLVTMCILAFLGGIIDRIK